MDTVDKLNEIFEAHKDECKGSFHNALWQIMINDSLGGEEAAFIQDVLTKQVAIAFGSGGYIPACFEAPDSTLDQLNEKVFGLTPDGVWYTTARSMRNKVNAKK